MTRSEAAAGLRIGIDLGGTKISGIVLAPEGSVPVAVRIASPRDDYAATLAAVADLVTTLEGRAGVRPGSLPVGIGTPGAWVPGVRRMRNCNSTWLNAQPLVDDLGARLGARVRVANDADCFALSEAVDGAGAGAGLVFGVILGTGVGGGIIFAGRAHGGPNGLGGEWGHTPLPYLRQPVRTTGGHAGELAGLERQLRQRPCYCGRLDCIEAFLSGPGLAAMHAELWQETVRPEELVGRSDERARSTLALHRELLARSLAQIVNVLDPDVIVLGGGLSNLPGLAAALEVRMPRYLFDSAGAATGIAQDAVVRVVRARWGDDSGVRGAARLWEVDWHFG